MFTELEKQERTCLMASALTVDAQQDPEVQTGCPSQLLHRWIVVVSVPALD